MDNLIKMTEKAVNVNRREDMNIVIVGHVDHGKSTIIGRLLADNNMLPEGKLEQIKEKCRRNSKPFEYAFLLDALKDEQSQGITIDAARVFFSTEKRNYIILDAPGHVEFLKNMVTGASRAEAALMVIDANEGIMENSKRHGYLLSMLGVKQISVLVNKMDIVSYSEKRFEEIKRSYGEFLREINVKPESFIPVSGTCGDNIVNPSRENMPWYTGKTVMEQLESFASAGTNSNLPLRLPVQDVYKFTADGDDRRIVAGTVETGILKNKTEVVFYPSGKRGRIKSIEAFNQPLPEMVYAGIATGFTLEEQIYVKRGDMVSAADEKAPLVSDKIYANVFWLGKAPFSCGVKYYVKLGTAKLAARLESVKSVLDAVTLEKTHKNEIARNEVGECIISFDRPQAFDTVENNPFTSRFVIVDNYEICGGGIITGAAGTSGGGNITPDSSLLTKDMRVLSRRQRGCVIWLTGLSGSGKSTISRQLELDLNTAGYAAYRLDGDNLRFGLNRDCDFSAEGRNENIRRAGEAAKLFADAGMIAICSFISPSKSMRKAVRDSVGDDFIEIFVKAPIETCIERDPKGLYKKAMNGEITNFTGIDSAYEEPEAPEVKIDTEKLSPSEAADVIMNYLSDNGFIF